MQPSCWADELPPLGPPVNLEKIDQDRAERNAGLEYTSIEGYQELASSFEATVRRLNQIRTSVGVAELDVGTSTIRLMSQDQWSRLERSGSAPESDAYFDPRTGNVYMLFDVARYTSSRTDQMLKAYIIAHELSHKATPVIAKFSFHLSEGIADYLAQDSLENGGLASFVSDEELSYRQTYLEACSEFVDGYELRAKDIFVEPGVAGGIVYSRIPQLRLIEIMQASMSAENFNDLLRSAFNGDETTVRRIIQEQFGDTLANALDDRQGLANPRALIELVVQDR